MKQGNLKNLISQHIEKQSLTDDQLDELLNSQQMHTRQVEQSTGYNYRWLASVAIFFMAITGVFYINTMPGNTLAERIGSEVAKNHIKLKPLEIQTSSIQVIRNYFTELDFLPIESSLLKQGNKTLLGARYCSIQGVTAAQLRLKDSKTGQVQSLYQTIYKPEVFTGLPKLEEGKQPITIYDKGLEVDIWVEKGLLFALTRETNN